MVLGYGAELLALRRGRIGAWPRDDRVGPLPSRCPSLRPAGLGFAKPSGPGSRAISPEVEGVSSRRGRRGFLALKGRGHSEWLNDSTHPRWSCRGRLPMSRSYSLKSTLKTQLPLLKFRVRNWRKATFHCPVCSFRGPFKDVAPPTGLRRHARCPKCGALERHRLQYLVLQRVLARLDPGQLRMLHFAPEAFFRPFFSARFGAYETSDLSRKDVDHNVDLQDLPFPDGSYDFVFASHVLEHIPDDTRAIREIRRILVPDGIAILPVPLVSQKTIEYPEPNPNEAGHVRAPGFDYFDRYLPHFSRVETHSSDAFPEKHQLYVYEDRRKWPNAECPLRQAMEGERHIDVVPVCHA